MRDNLAKIHIPLRQPSGNSAHQKSKRPQKPQRVKPKRSGRGRFFWVKFFLNILLWVLIVISVGVFWFGYDLPDVERLQATTRDPGISIISEKGELIATYGDIYGAHVSSEQLPAHVSNAFLAIEDRRFRSHFGLDFIGILRAAYSNYKAGHVVQGGSSITQQLAKNFLLSEKMYVHSDRSMRRKVQEVLLALWLEHKFTKDQILSLYLNRVYLGAGVYGIEAAAQKYFGKRAKSLNLYESAVIAGLLKAPSKYSPTNSPQLAHKRATIVLNRMVEGGFITAHEKATLSSSSESMSGTHERARTARYFVDWIVETLPQYVGNISEDLVVITSLDLQLQKKAEEEAAKLLEGHGKVKGFSQTALVSMSVDGAVKAMVGGVDYKKSKFNRATQARRQPGSSYKFFVYLSAIEAGFTKKSLVSDEPIKIGNWQPKNFHWKTRGQISFQDAFAYSVNTVSVRLAKLLGAKRIARTAHRLGITTPSPSDLSIALGTADVTLLQMTSAYATIANGGLGVWPYTILEVRNRNGKVLYRRKTQGLGRVVEYNHAKEMIDILVAVMNYGTGKSAKLKTPCAGKSGTSQDHRDGWFVGFSTDPNLVTGVWVGNDDRSPTKGVTGGNMPALLWKNFMNQ